MNTARPGAVINCRKNRRAADAFLGFPVGDLAKEAFARPGYTATAQGEDSIEETAPECIGQVGLVCASTPDFQERLWLNDARVELGKPMVDQRSQLRSRACKLSTQGRQRSSNS